MILSILLAFIIAKIKKYKIIPVFKTYELYPLFALELLYWFFQINAFMGIYDYVKYAPYLQNAFMLVLFIPIIKHKLYKPALVGSTLVIIGTILNKVVIFANNGKMPVFPTLSKITGYFKENALSQGIDNLHILLTADTKLNILADYIDVGWSVMSIGDILIHSFVLVIVYYSIKAINKKNGDSLK